MPSNTTYTAIHSQYYSALALNFNAIGVQGTVPRGTIKNIDYKFTDDCLITGMMFLCKNQVFGDTVTLQCVDVDGVLYPAGTVLKQFATNWGIFDDRQLQVDISVEYPAKIFAGLYLRVIYTSTGITNDVNILINYRTHKVLF